MGLVPVGLVATPTLLALALQAKLLSSFCNRVERRIIGPCREWQHIVAWHTANH